MRRALVVLGVLAALGLFAGAAYAAFFSTASNPTSSFTAAPDWVAPTVGASLVGESAGGATYDSTVLADSPLGYWRLGESSGTTATDSSGNGRSGTYLGGYTLGSAGAINSANTAVSFNNLDARAEITSSAFQLTGSLSVEAWVRPTVNNGNNAIFDKTIGGNTNTSYLLWLGGGKPKCRLVKGGSQFDASSGSALTANAWAHVVCAWDGTNIRLYVNNSLVDTTALTGPISTGSGVNIIGRLGGGTFPFNGVIDEVAVYGSALSATRIDAHYQAASAALTDAVRQCKPYYVYADVTDTGNPASGVASVQSNLSSVTAGATAAALSAGSYLVGSTTYNYRGGPLVAEAAPGTPTYAITSIDSAANSRTQSGFPATVVSPATPPTPIFLSGIEQGVASPANLGVFTAAVGAVSADGSVKRNGSYSLLVAAANADTRADFTIPSANRFAVVRFAIRLGSLPSQTVNLFTLVPSGGNAMNFVFNSATGSFGVRWGTNAITDGTVAPAAGTWYRVEVSANLNNPRTVDWRVDGVDQTRASSAEGAQNVTVLRLGTNATNVTYTANYDDIIASQTSADYPIGNGKVLALVPDGMGTSSGTSFFQNDDGTSIDSNTWSRVDEIPASSTDDYVKQVTNSNSSYVELTFGDTSAGCFNGVGARLAYHAPTTAGNSGTTQVLDGSTTTVVYNGSMNTTSLSYKRAILSSAAGWSQSAVNGLRARIGFSSDTSPNPYWDDLLLEYDVPLG